METQKDWDSPVDDSNDFDNSNDFANPDDFDNSNDFADNLSIADLSIDADSAQSALDSGRVDALDYCYEGFEPLQPSGERLTLADAGPYFAKAVDNTYAADGAVRIAAAGRRQGCRTQSRSHRPRSCSTSGRDLGRPHVAEIVDQANPTGHYRIPGTRVVLCESDDQSQCRGHRLDSVRAVPGIRRAISSSQPHSLGTHSVSRDGWDTLKLLVKGGVL